jgi:hypothetical protein
MEFASMAGVTGFRSPDREYGRVSLGFARGFEPGSSFRLRRDNKNGRPQKMDDHFYYGRCDWI